MEPRVGRTHRLFFKGGPWHAVWAPTSKCTISTSVDAGQKDQLRGRTIKARQRQNDCHTGKQTSQLCECRGVVCNLNVNNSRLHPLIPTIPSVYLGPPPSHGVTAPSVHHATNNQSRRHDKIPNPQASQESPASPFPLPCISSPRRRREKAATQTKRTAQWQCDDACSWQCPTPSSPPLYSVQNNKSQRCRKTKR
ncbi:hypothetical protein LX36DRAFT_293644 [Colletotrichum falcatum]|nr:hypothetical protein LX36DRAFT_293644 [Colletotrichum falcatum]